MKMKNRSHRYDIKRPKSRHRHNIVNIKSVSIWLCLHVLSNTWKATFEKAKKVKLKKLSNTEAVEKSVAYTKSISSLVFSWDLIHSKW